MKSINDEELKLLSKSEAEFLNKASHDKWKRLNRNLRVFTKSELLDYIEKEMHMKFSKDYSIQSLEKIADILNIDLSDAIIKEG